MWRAGRARIGDRPSTPPPPGGKYISLFHGLFATSFSLYGGPFCSFFSMRGAFLGACPLPPPL